MIPDHETYAYSASKAGLHHLSRAMGGRLGWEGITSNTIACGQYFGFIVYFDPIPPITMADPAGFLGPFPSKSPYQIGMHRSPAAVFTDLFAIQ